MTDKAPQARFTVATLGVDDIRRSIAFYEALGFTRKMRATGDDVAFFDTGASVIALYPWENLAADAALPQDKSASWGRITFAWNCRDSAEVDAAMAKALASGATLVKAGADTHYGGYCGYFADPDGHIWEAVTAPGIEVLPDGRVKLPD